MTKTLPAYLLFLFVLFSSFAISFGQNTLSGRITNNEGEPLSFANIVVTHSIEKGVETLVKSQNGTTSDIDGYYILTGIPNGKFVVKVIYIGYDEKTFQIDFVGEVSSILAMKQMTLTLTSTRRN